MRNFRIHPLFWLYMFMQTLRGNFLEVLTLLPSAVIHELGHALAASLEGYAMEEMTIMPYGAVLSLGETPRGKKATPIALAGPLTSGLIAMLMASIWWIFPEVYSSTSSIFRVNASLAVFNLLPIYPLDGGRIVHGLIKDGDKAYKFARLSGVIGGTLLFVLGMTSLFFSPNYSLILMGAMLPASSMSSSANERYKSLAESVSLQKSTTHPVLVKEYVITEGQKIGKLLRLINPEEEIRFTLKTPKGNVYLTESDVAKMCLQHDFNKSVGCVAKNENLLYTIQ